MLEENLSIDESSVPMEVLLRSFGITGQVSVSPLMDLVKDFVLLLDFICKAALT